MSWYNEVGILGLELFVDVAKRRRNLDSGLNREAETWGCSWVSSLDSE